MKQSDIQAKLDTIPENLEKLEILRSKGLYKTLLEIIEQHPDDE